MSITKFAVARKESAVPVVQMGDTEFLRYIVRQGDNPVGNSGNRNEWTWGNRNETLRGATTVIGMTTWLPEDFKVGTSDWYYTCQFHKDGDQGGWGGPTLGLTLSPDSNWKAKGRTGTKGNTKVSLSKNMLPMKNATPYKHVFHIKWHPSDGFWNHYINGDQVLNHAGPTLFNDGSNAYMKTGLYSNSYSFTRVVYTTIPVFSTIDSVKEVQDYLNSIADNPFGQAPPPPDPVLCYNDTGEVPHEFKAVA